MLATWEPPIGYVRCIIMDEWLHAWLRSAAQHQTPCHVGIITNGRLLSKGLPSAAVTGFDGTLPREQQQC